MIYGIQYTCYDLSYKLIENHLDLTKLIKY